MFQLKIAFLEFGNSLFYSFIYKTMEENEKYNCNLTFKINEKHIYSSPKGFLEFSVTLKMS